MTPIYMDHAATTPTDARVVEAMLPFFTSTFGNASSVYSIGTKSSEALNRARETVADAIGAERKEIIFTSGASEAINLALKGVALERRRTDGKKHVITSAIEHHATLHTVDYLVEQGFESTILGVDEYGMVSVEEFQNALRDDTAVVSIMLANNEIGTIQPVEAIGAVCKKAGVPFHIDAVQGVGTIPVDVDDLNADLLSMSGHKFYGPKGTGALFVRRDTPLMPQLNGGGQEGGRRGGTENIPGIIGLATALRIAVDEREARAAHARSLRDRLLERILQIPYVRLNGHPTNRLPHNLHVTFEYMEGNRTTESLLTRLDAAGICASTGSACNSRSIKPSHVLTAIGLPASSAHSSLRLTLGRSNDEAQVDFILEQLPAMVDKVRSVSPTYHEHKKSGG